eukprot:scaffold2330_cov376-Prasinococcus_capsulatus_cf.AAC.7
MACSSSALPRSVVSSGAGGPGEPPATAEPGGTCGRTPGSACPVASNLVPPASMGDVRSRLEAAPGASGVHCEGAALRHEGSACCIHKGGGRVPHSH